MRSAEVGTRSSERGTENGEGRTWSSEREKHVSREARREHKGKNRNRAVLSGLGDLGVPKRAIASGREGARNSERGSRNGKAFTYAMYAARYHELHEWDESLE